MLINQLVSTPPFIHLCRDVCVDGAVAVDLDAIKIMTAPNPICAEVATYLQQRERMALQSMSGNVLGSRQLHGKLWLTLGLRWGRFVIVVGPLCDHGLGPLWDHFGQ